MPNVSWLFDQATASSGGGEVHHNAGSYFAQAHSDQQMTGVSKSFTFECFASPQVQGVRFGIMRASLLPGVVAATDLDYYWAVQATISECRRIGSAYVSEASTSTATDLLSIHVESDGDVVWKKNGVEVARREGDTHSFPYVGFFQAANEGDLGTAKTVGTTDIEDAPILPYFSHGHSPYRRIVRVSSY